MTPKEKAEEIVSKYRGTFFRNMSDGDAKRCALIAVNEILKSGRDVHEFADSYWQEVKQEIEKL